jgi:hypothetical protein
VLSAGAQGQTRIGQVVSQCDLKAGGGRQSCSQRLRMRVVR